ncbi:hypothetical protein OX90_26135 [Pseudomonas coronafaciens pv. porri]|uniref:Uncharacterized protein n=1 Tax=Pseudomonas coronafaciens pv. porri TaxID=83964 RepID=A0ABR5JGT0_9PSED|nr:hypothetical protein OX90_26135 [Pseudomonas coronafaciens pv. porri]KOP53449.1 hypothetical protein OX88_20270 [Pseudomonas coronafaciens pv. porri]
MDKRYSVFQEKKDTLELSLRGHASLLLHGFVQRLLPEISLGQLPVQPPDLPQVPGLAHMPALVLLAVVLAPLIACVFAYCLMLLYW